MQLLNSTIEMLSNGWNYYFETMMNFKEAHPALAYFTLSFLAIAITYLTVKSLMTPVQRKYKLFDIKNRVENPSWYGEGLARLGAAIITFPIAVVVGLFCLGVELYASCLEVLFHFTDKKYESTDEPL